MTGIVILVVKGNVERWPTSHFCVLCHILWASPLIQWHLQRHSLCVDNFVLQVYKTHHSFSALGFPGPWVGPLRTPAWNTHTHSPEVGWGVPSWGGPQPLDKRFSLSSSSGQFRDIFFTPQQVPVGSSPSCPQQCPAHKHPCAGFPSRPSCPFPQDTSHIKGARKALPQPLLPGLARDNTVY